MQFEWLHRENDKESYVSFNCKIVKSVDKSTIFRGRLICSYCEADLQQLYRCENCNKEFRLGEIKKRKDEETGIVYTVDEKKQFLKQKIETKINVEAEINLDDVIPNIELIKDFYEIYGDNKIVKIHRWLWRHRKALVVSFGYREKWRAGIIIPARTKLVLAELRDFRTIREAKQEGIEEITTEADRILEEISKDREPDLMIEFLEAKRQGKVIVKKKEEKKKEVKEVEVSFLDD